MAPGYTCPFCGNEQDASWDDWEGSEFEDRTSPDFCFNDNFISFWELLWNFNCDDNCDVVERIAP